MCTTGIVIYVIQESADSAIKCANSVRVRVHVFSLTFLDDFRQNLLPDFISVTVHPTNGKDDPLNIKRIIVEIINIPIIKPFLGGYVNRKTGGHCVVEKSSHLKMRSRKLNQHQYGTIYNPNGH